MLDTVCVPSNLWRYAYSVFFSFMRFESMMKNMITFLQLIFKFILHPPFFETNFDFYLLFSSPLNVDITINLMTCMLI